jgi:chromosome segregation protein
LRQQVLRFLHESSTLKNRITQVQGQFEATERDRARAAAEEQQSLTDLERVQQVKGQLSERLQARQSELVSLTDQRRDLERELGERRTAAGAQRHAIDGLRTEASRVRARRESLENILQHRSYTTDTVKRLFKDESKFKPIGVLGDFIEVDPQIEKTAEEFLHEELEYVVVEGWTEADRGIELMRGELNGRATFLVENAGQAQVEVRPVAIPEGEDVRPLAAALRLTNGLTQLPFGQLPRIAQCYITADRETAQRLAPEFPQCWFLTPDGASYQGHAVTGGKKSGAGPLVLKRELREARQSEEARERELQKAQSELAEVERSIQTLTHGLEDVRNRQQAQEKDVLALDHETAKLGEESQRAQSRLSKARLELHRVAEDRVRLEANLGRDREALVEAESKRAEREAELESARAELTAAQQAAAAVNEEHAVLRAGVAAFEERGRSIGAHCARLDHQLRELSARRGSLERETERLTAERTALETSNQELGGQQEQLAGEIAQHQEKATELAAREAELRTAIGSLEEQIKGLRAEVQQQAERRAQTQIALARAESDLRHLDESCRGELGVAVAELSEGVETVPDEGGLTDLEQMYGEVKRKIEALGPVNPQALEEFEEAQQRQEFLTVQRQDLLDSIRDTEKAIGEIDGESRKRFVEAFRAINANFRELFQTLFGGGTGEMRLTDEENAAESGIDIVASPPGKKLQSVLLLSGGEKSLTAMALLMAIFQYTPSPFCILDEVDAPLDEPNIERLTRLIREMAEQTQFIIITHSKRTMEAAQSLYGVTMQEPGVSKLVSVKFGSERAQAAAPAAVQRHLQPALA